MSDLPDHATELELALMGLTHEGTARAQANQLAALAPFVDRERGIAVIRLDAELASWLNKQADHYEWGALGLEGFERGIAIAKAEYLRRAARIIGGESDE